MFTRIGAGGRTIRLIVALASGLAVTACANGTAQPAPPKPPVYVHMNGANEFLESLVAVAPGQPVVFVNQDTGKHTIVGYNPNTGAIEPAIDGFVSGTPGAGHPVSTYTVRFSKPGAYAYYCSVHATLKKTFGSAVQPARRKGVHGFGGVMGGWIIVTDDAQLPRENPTTSSKRILSGFFGG